MTPLETVANPVQNSLTLILAVHSVLLACRMYKYTSTRFKTRAEQEVKKADHLSKLGEFSPGPHKQLN